MASVIDHYGDNQDVIIANAGPGHWNDPDMVRMFNLRPSFNFIRLIQFFNVVHVMIFVLIFVCYGVLK